MRKIYIGAFFTFLVGFGFGCKNNDGPNNDNYSTPTEKMGSTELDGMEDVDLVEEVPAEGTIIRSDTTVTETRTETR